MTLSAMGLIIYRVSGISRQSKTPGRYNRIIKLLTESGVLYCVPLLLTSVLLVTIMMAHQSSTPLIEATLYSSSILIPMKVGILVIL